MTCSSKYRQHLVPASPLQVGGVSLPPSSTCRYLGVTIDSKLTLAPPVSNLVRLAFFNLHRIGRIRHKLDAATAKQLVHATVISHLDYCNSILIGSSKALINRLQQAQNSAARLILRVRRRKHIRRHLASLHWLPIRQRIVFKIACLTYSCLCHCDSRPLSPPISPPSYLSIPPNVLSDLSLPES